MTYALIDPNQKVCQIVAETFIVAPPFTFVECDPDANTSWVYVNGAVVPPPPEDIEVVRARVAQMVDASASASLNALRTEYPAWERETWAQQAEEAQKIASGGAPATCVLLQQIATQRGMPIEELVSRIISNATAYKTLTGYVVGRRYALHQQVASASTLEQLAAISW